jgi:hypothetical protein
LIASLHVASKHRGVILDELDFVLGGSSLGMLAKKSGRQSQVAFRLPLSSTGTIVVLNNREYFQNYADVGFQFERLVTGVQFNPKAVIEFSEHMHEMKVGSHRVMFLAEADACSTDEEPVEIKCSSKSQRRTDVMFQMISSGSLWLCHGEKDFHDFKSAKLMQLSEVVDATLKNRNAEALEGSILECLTAIKAQMMNAQDGEVFDVKFVGETLQLHRIKRAIMFPPPKVVSELLL